MLLDSTNISINREVFKMMILNEHTINETPPVEKPLLMLIEKNDEYLWTVGYWDNRGWHCEYDKI